jgi:hypothetical protein
MLHQLLTNEILSEKIRKFEPRSQRGKPDAKDTKFKTQSRDIVQNRVSVLDKAAFSFAVTRQMKKHPVFLGDLRVLSDHAKAWERAVNNFLGLRECPALVLKGVSDEFGHKKNTFAFIFLLPDFFCEQWSKRHCSGYES